MECMLFYYVSGILKDLLCLLAKNNFIKFLFVSKGNNLYSGGGDF